MRVGGGVLGLGHRRVDVGTLGRLLDLLVGGIAAIDQPGVRVLSAALANLLEHGHQLAHVAAGGGRLDADDDLALGVGGELGVVGGTVAAVGHLHDGGLGVGVGDTRALARRLLAASGRSRVGIELFLEALDLRARRLVSIASASHRDEMMPPRRWRARVRRLAPLA